MDKLISTSQISTYSSEELSLIFEYIKSNIDYFKSKLTDWLKSTVDLIIQSDIQHIVYISRQGSFFRHLIEGALDELEIEHPTMDDLAIDSSSEYTDISLRTDEDLKSLRNILGHNITGTVLFIDDLEATGNTTEIIHRLMKELRSKVDYKIVHYGKIAPWDIKPFISSGLRSSKITTKSAHMFLPHKLNDSSFHANPSAPELNPNLNDTNLYKRIAGILYNIGRETMKH